MSLAGEFNGLAFGPGTQVHVAKMEGVEDLPDVRASAPMRSNDHGAWGASALAGTRKVTMEFHLIPELPGTTATYETIRDLFKTAMVIEPTELPLKVYGSTKRMNCLVVRRHIPVQCERNQDYATAVVEFLATDPRIYSELENSETANLATVSGGATFPAMFNMAFGAVGVGGTINATNTGNFPTRPVATISGPVDNPSIENITTGKTIAFDISLLAGDSLVVDFDARSILLNGGSRRSALTVDSTWWELAPGLNEIRFQATTYTAGATMNLVWRSAWL